MGPEKLAHSFIRPNWPAPPQVRTLITTRVCGSSSAPFDYFNLASHVGDEKKAVESNRNALCKFIGAEVPWLQQVHGTRVYRLGDYEHEDKITADGTITSSKRRVCAVLTADCLPILICTKAGDRVAAVHGGWRGLSEGIISKAVKAFECPPNDLLVYLGPAISQAMFEVDKEVLQSFESAASKRNFAEPVGCSFISHKTTKGKYFADLYRLARAELVGAGISGVYGGDFCTFSDRRRFYSFRRDGMTGRMVSLIWIDTRQ